MIHHRTSRQEVNDPAPIRRGCSFTNEFIKREFEFLRDEQKEILIASLREMNYEGFQEEGDLLKAYISSTLYNENGLKKSTKHTSTFVLTN